MNDRSWTGINRAPSSANTPLLSYALRNSAPSMPLVESAAAGAAAASASTAQTAAPRNRLRRQKLPAELAERLGDALPWSSVALLPGCGHFLLEDAPETVGPLIVQWLRTRYLQLPQAHAHEGGAVTVELGRRPPEDGRW